MRVMHIAKTAGYSVTMMMKACKLPPISWMVDSNYSFAHGESCYRELVTDHLWQPPPHGGHVFTVAMLRSPREHVLSQ
jgi:hypothetical protein